MVSAKVIYFLQHRLNNFLACHPSCFACNGPFATDCIINTADFLLYYPYNGQNNESTCLQGFYKDENFRTCECHPSC